MQTIVGHFDLDIMNASSEGSGESEQDWPEPLILGNAIRLIKPLVMSAYQIINFHISQPKHMLYVLKRTVSMRRSF